MVNKNLIANIEEAAQAVRVGPKHAPSWINTPLNSMRPEDILVCRNGYLYLPTQEFLPKSSVFFTVNGSPVEYDKNADKPIQWLKFLNQLFPNEPDCIDSIQEMIGYFLTQDTSLQKIFQIVGPRRAGKGVIIRIIQSLIGVGNYVSPTPNTLKGSFGKQPLLNKQL